MPKKTSKEKMSPRLGRGLASLIGEESIAVAISPQVDSESKNYLSASEGVRKIPIEFIANNPNNPRKTFTENELSELIASIKEKGIFQPILVRTKTGKKNKYEIIAGERRWRAAQKAGLHEIPAIVREVSDQEALELAIVENVQRTDLNPIEEATGYAQLIEMNSLSHGQLGKVVGKSRSYISNSQGLLKLPDSVKELMVKGELTVGHARPLVTANDPAKLADAIVNQGLTVRQTEELMREGNSNEIKKVVRLPVKKDADTIALEKKLSDSLGLKITIKSGKKGRGEMRIKYTSLDQFDDIYKLLTRKK